MMFERFGLLVSADARHISTVRGGVAYCRTYPAVPIHYGQHTTQLAHVASKG